MAPVEDVPTHGLRGPGFTSSAVLIALAILSIILRFYIRIFTRAGLGIDDWFLMIAVVTEVMTASIVVSGNECPALMD